MTKSIDIGEYLSCDLVTKAEIDYLFNYLNTEDSKNAELLKVSAIYLKTLSSFQLKLIESQKINFDNLNIEQKLRYLSYERNCSNRIFEELWLKSQNEDLKYDRGIRNRLIKLNIIEASSPIPDGVRPEFLALHEALFKNDLSEIYKYSYQISNHDFKDFTEKEKEIVLEILKVDSAGVSLAIGFSVIDENKISFGVWRKFWKTLSSYKPGDDIEDNHFLYHKSLCIQADYGDERIDMSMFPNLPSIYDSDDFYDSDTFISQLNWSSSFELYEIDFILAVALSIYNQDRADLLDQVNAYIRK